MRDIDPTIRRVVGYFDVALKAVISICCALMFVTVVIQVANRYILTTPLFWTDEAATYLMVWGIFLACFYAYLDGSHVQVTFLTDRLRPRAQKLVSLVVNTLVLGFLVAVTVAGLDHASQFLGFKTPMLRIPRIVPYISAPVSAFLMMGVTIRNIILDVAFLKMSYRESQAE